MRASARKLLESTVANLLVILLVIVSFGAGVYIVTKQYTYSACVATWANNYSEAVKVRSTASNTRLNALNKLVLDAVTQPGQASSSKDLAGLYQALASDDQSNIQKFAAQYLKDSGLANSNSPIQEDIQNFIQTEDNYQATVKAHPLPQDPKFLCK